MCARARVLMTASVINIFHGWFSLSLSLSRPAEHFEKNSEGFPMAFALPQYVETIKRVTAREDEGERCAKAGRT